MFIDTHAHLNFEAFDQDFKAVISRAFYSGVLGIINVGSQLETSQKAIQIAQKHKHVYAAVGLHPIHVLDEKFNKEQYFQLAIKPEVVALGETGLDYFKEKISPEEQKLQKSVFLTFLETALEIGKPVILHCRKAESEVLDILKTKALPGVFHCFPGDWEYAKAILDLGFYISFTGSITYNLSKKTFEVIKKTPIERLLIETDCPFMTPLKYRKKGFQIRNEPAYVVEVAKKIAQIKKLPLKKVEEETSQNAIELFGLRDLRHKSD